MGRNCAYTPETLFVVTTDGLRSQKGKTMASCTGVKRPSNEYLLKPMVRSDSCTSTITVSSSASMSCVQQPGLQRPPRLSSSADQIRSRFLNRLGFTQSEPQIGARNQRSSLVVSSGILRGKEFTVQDLKGDHGRQWKNDNSSSSNLTATPSRRRPCSVSFDTVVKVHSIPKHTEYSDRIRDQLWVKASVQQKNMARNCIEYAAEGWNWQDVEEEMIVFANGDKVHPVHLSSPQNNLGWRFCAVRAMQQRHHQHR